LYAAVAPGVTIQSPSLPSGADVVKAVAVPERKYSASVQPTDARSKVVSARNGFPRPPVTGPSMVGLGTAAAARTAHAKQRSETKTRNGMPGSPPGRR